MFKFCHLTSLGSSASLLRRVSSIIIIIIFIFSASSFLAKMPATWAPRAMAAKTVPTVPVTRPVTAGPSHTTASAPSSMNPESTRRTANVVGTHGFITRQPKSLLKDSVKVFFLIWYCLIEVFIILGLY